MSTNFSNALYQNLLRQEGDDLFGLWLATLDDENNHTLPSEIVTFEYRRDVFLWALERLLKEGRIKLANNALVLARKHGEPWGDEKYLAKGTIEEQMEIFRKAWPESEVATGYEDFYWWFFDDACPYCVNWQPA